MTAQRVTHVITTLDPSHGGPPVVVARLAAAQSALGADVEVLHVVKPASDHQAPARIATLLAGLDLPPGTPAPRFESIPRAGPLPSWLGRCPLRARVQDAARQGRTIHVHELWTHTSFNASDAALRAGTPLVFTAHGMLHPWSLAQRPLRKRVALMAHFRRALGRASFIHALNDDERAHLAALDLGQRRPPIEVIANAIDPREFAQVPAHQAPPSEATHRTDQQHPPTALFLSRLHHKKGLDILADAWALAAPKVPTAKLLVAGPDDGARAGFEAAIARAGLTARTELLGPIYGPDKLALLERATCFVLPSRQEGFSIAILEALACATPALISPECCFPQVATRSAGIVAPALTPQAFADGLVALLSDQHKARAMGQAGRAMVLSDYTWPVIARQMLDAYARHARG
jgi:glycosyltransferase involved in cell wall biosynthesis